MRLIYKTRYLRLKMKENYDIAEFVWLNYDVCD